MILLSIPLFLITEIVVFLPLYVLGLIFYPLADKFADRTITLSIWPDKVRLAFSNKFLDWWLGNYEDGLNPVWWIERGGTAYGWFKRNPVTNLRFAPLLSTRITPSKVKFLGYGGALEDGQPGWFLAWCGAYGGFRWQNTRYGIWIGYKVRPEDRFGVHDYRQFGVGTALQFVRF